MENLHIPKEGGFAGLDPIFNFRKIAAFEDRLGKPKPLLGGAFRSFAGRKSVQHGTVEHYCAILKGKIVCSACAYWLLAARDVSFFYLSLNLSKLRVQKPRQTEADVAARDHLCHSHLIGSLYFPDTESTVGS